MKITRNTVLAALITLICAVPARAALVPFTATSDPDFSHTLEIYVPDGWSHRNAEGMTELVPPSGDKWLCAEAGNLGKRTPAAWALLLSEGRYTRSADGSTNCYSWSGEDASGAELVHFFAASPERDMYVRFTWTRGLGETTMDITGGSRLAGGPLSYGIQAGSHGYMPDSEAGMIMAFAKWYDEREPRTGGHDPRVALSFVYADEGSRELRLDSARLNEHHNWSGRTRVLRNAGGMATGIECEYAEGNVYQHNIVGAIDAQGAAWAVEEQMGGPQLIFKLYKNGEETREPAPRELAEAVAASGYKYLLDELAAAK